MKINVLSLFDGISCGRIALERAGIDVGNYYASEINKNAIIVSKDNYPDIIQIGDVTKINYKDGILVTEYGEFETQIDLLIGGSPCQDFSNARLLSFKNTNGLLGDKSSLFYYYLEILNKLQAENPQIKFLMENVQMKPYQKKELDNYLGVCGVLINSELLSFQKRRRYYWANFKFDLPEDKKISFQTYKESGPHLNRHKLNRTKSRERMWSGGVGRITGVRACANVTNSDKIHCVTTKQDRWPNSGLVEYEDFCRYLSQNELEQAQTLPINYTKSLSYNKACEVIGNCWTVDVISHVLRFMEISK